MANLGFTNSVKGHSMIRRWLVFGSFTLLARLGEGAQPLDLRLYTPMNVDGGGTAVSTTLALHNPNRTPLKYTLVLKDFRSVNTGKDSGSVVSFYGPDNKPAGPMLTGEASPDQTISVRIDVSHLVEAGESVAELQCNDVRIGDLKAMKSLGFPFKVSLEGNPPEKPEIELVNGSSLDLHLDNDDAMNYPLSWELFIKGKSKSGTLLAGPNGSSRFTVEPAAQWFSVWRSFFTDEVADGKLIVGYKPPGATGSYPSKTIPVKARLSAYNPGLRDVVAMIVILVILAAGGLFSAYINVVLVNRIKAIAIRKSLGKLARTIGEIGPQLNSQLRVSLFLERGRITATLPKGFFFTPETAAVLLQSEADAKTLKSRVDMAEQISDAALRQMREMDAGLGAPSLMDRATKKLSAAQDLLRKSALSDAEVDKIRTLVGSVVNILDDFEKPDEDLDKEIANRIQALRKRFTPAVLADHTCIKIKGQAPIPFGVLTEDGGSQAELDTNTRKLAVIYDLVRMKSADHHMIECLRRQDYDALASAELFLRQLKEEISVVNLQHAISANPPQLSVKLDRDTVRVNTPILLKLVFNEPRYNRAAAKRLIECTWGFDGNKLTEKGWEVYHYFPDPGPSPVSLIFKNRDQSAIPHTDFPYAVPVSPPRSEGYGQAAVEGQRWLAGFFVALVGLFAGAKDKILSLDTAGAIFAVFLLGFSIDMAKNFLVAKQS
jgi:hypothetical protein